MEELGAGIAAEDASQYPTRMSHWSGVIPRADNMAGQQCIVTILMAWQQGNPISIVPFVKYAVISFPQDFISAIAFQQLASVPLVLFPVPSSAAIALRLKDCC